VPPPPPLARRRRWALAASALAPALTALLPPSSPLFSSAGVVVIKSPSCGKTGKVTAPPTPNWPSARRPPRALLAPRSPTRSRLPSPQLWTLADLPHRHQGPGREAVLLQEGLL
jgi:hypothetical protein